MLGAKFNFFDKKLILPQCVLPFLLRTMESSFFWILMSRWTGNFVQILKDRGSVINAPDDHYHLLMMFSFAFPMDSLLVDDPCWTLCCSILHEFPLHFKRRERMWRLYTQKSLFPTFFFKTFYALKKSNLENNRANERVQKERKRKVWNCFRRKTMFLAPETWTFC